MKLISQLRLTFNPRLKTHVTVMCEILEKIYRLQDSPYMVTEILELISTNMQFMKKSDLEEVNGQPKSRSSFDSINQSLLNLTENVNCPQFI